MADADLIYGLHSVKAALDAGTDLRELWVIGKRNDPRLTEVLVLAERRGVKAQKAEPPTAQMAPAKVYVVGIDAAYAPFESQNEKGEIVGFSVDLMRVPGGQGAARRSCAERQVARIHTAV